MMLNKNKILLSLVFALRETCLVVVAISIRPLQMTEVDRFSAFRAGLFTEDTRCPVSRRDDLISHVKRRLDTGSTFIVATTDEEMKTSPSKQWPFSLQPSLDVSEMLCQRLNDGNYLVGIIECSSSEFELPTHSLGSNNLYLIALGVHPQRRREGIASMLLEAADAFARTQKADALWLHVESDNQKAIDFYQAAQFTKQDSSFRSNSDGRQLAIALGINPDLHFSFFRQISS